MQVITSVHEYCVTIQKRILQCPYSVQGGGGGGGGGGGRGRGEGGETRKDSSFIATQSHHSTPPQSYCLPTPRWYFRNAQLLTFRRGKIDTANSRTHQAYELCIYHGHLLRSLLHNHRDKEHGSKKYPQCHT